jgi:hypothetical protein
MERMQREKDEMQRTFQLEMDRLQRQKDEMQRTFQLEMERLQREKDEVQRTSQLEKDEMQRTSQLEKMEMQRTFQLEMGEMQMTFQLEKMEMQRVRQQEEEKKLEGSSGMSWNEEGIECDSSAVPGLTGPAEGTYSCTATEGKAESLLLGAKGYPPMWRSEMFEVRSDDCEGREQRTEEASRQKLEQRMAGLVAMLVVVLVGSSGHSRGGLIRKKEAIRGRMDEPPQENVMALVGQWRPAATPMATTR